MFFKQFEDIYVNEASAKRWSLIDVTLVDQKRTRDTNELIVFRKNLMR